MGKVYSRNTNVQDFNEHPTVNDIFINSPIAIELYDKDGQLTEVNKACIDLFGIRTFDQVRGFNLFEDPNLPDQAKIDIRSGKSVKYEFEFDFDLIRRYELYESTRSGSSFLECFLNPCYNQQNELKGYILYINEITNRKKSEALLKVNELNYRTIFNFISEAIFILEVSDGKIIDVNDAMLNLYGYESKEEIINGNIGDLSSKIKPYNQELAQHYILKANTNGKQSFEWQAKRKDGSIFWIEMTLKKAMIGGVYRILAFGKDITEHKQIIQTLADSENKYRSLIQHSSDPIFSFNPDETYRFVNETFAKAFGKKPEDIIGKTPHEIFPAEEANKRLATVRKVFITGEKSEIEVKVITDAGLTRYFLTMADPVKNNSGQVQYVTCVSKDITQRKIAEEALKRSEEKFRTVIESSLIGIHFYELGEDNRLIFKDANPAADKITGFQNRLLFGQPIEEAFPNLVYNDLPNLFKKIARGEADSKEFELDYKDDRISCFVKIQAFQTEMDSVAVMFIDISENKKVESLLEQQATQLKELNLTKDKFLSIIAHDLKNPFNAIIGFTDLMLNNFSQMDDETLVRGLRTIESASNHAYKLLENLLLWSKNQSGITEFNPEKLNLYSQVVESLSLIESAAINKDIDIRVRIKKSLDIFADKNMTDTILRNLISNAIKFSYRGGKIKISATEEITKVNISVIDEGIGINLDKKDAIFTIDKKTQILGTENEHGTGLGLILCKDFVSRHEGEIWFENNVKKGTTFIFSLPLVNEIS
ncbi:MAG: PAS domain S-box protein [Prolixibacteraceae bacterium]